MNRIILSFLCVLLVSCGEKKPIKTTKVESKDIQKSNIHYSKEKHLQNIKQLTFGGDNAEAYFSFDDTRLVFQLKNPEIGIDCDQIYVTDWVNDNIKKKLPPMVSTGLGRTTCSYFMPGDTTVIYASTHLGDKNCPKEPGKREDGAYVWPIYPDFDIFIADLKGNIIKQLTDATGYDAEATVSPQGDKIVFTSNRSGDLELYTMNIDGSNVKQITFGLGYDGGAFFSPDGRKLIFRSSRPKTNEEIKVYKQLLSEGLVKPTEMELFICNADGSDLQQITQLGNANWAPFFHPSNQYLIFSTNLHGFDNFELYAVDVNGERKPIRITQSPGFDGLPSFSPDGKTLSWTSTNTSDKKSQIFIADWNHAEVLHRLNLISTEQDSATKGTPLRTATATSPKILDEDVRNHLSYLCSDALEGRFTGSKGEKLASDYVADSFQAFGLEPFTSEGEWIQGFPFFNAAELSPACKFENSSNGKDFTTLQLAKEWTPMPFSESGEVEFDKITFAGYGLRLKKTSEWPEYDSYTHLDVKDKWVMVLRKLPTQWNEKRKQAHYYDSTFRKKASVARDLGAKGIIFVSDFEQPNDQLIEFSASPAKDTISIHAISVSRSIVSKLFAQNSRVFQAWCGKLAKGEPYLGFELKNSRFRLSIAIERKKGIGRNTLGWIRSQPGKVSDQFLVIGAHIDHIGIGKTSSRAKKSEKGKIHPGADDNASGIGCLLEIAEYLADLRKRGLLNSRYDILFAAWSGEEIGLVGSSYFMRKISQKKPQDRRRVILAYLNMDMVGRYEKKLTLHGVGSSTGWRKLIQQANVPVGLNLNLQNDSHIPTDTTSFFTKGIPILSAFTGLHPDYHSPSDTAEKINYKGVADCSMLYSRLVQALVKQNELDYVAQAPPPKSRGRLRVYLGTIPDYSQTDKKGVSFMLNKLWPNKYG